MPPRDVAGIIEPLVQHQLFPSVEEAARSLVLERILREIDRYRDRMTALETQYGMPFEQFGAYLKERSALLSNSQLDAHQRKSLAQAVMTEEEDWLDWKIARDFLEAWLGLKSETAV